MPAATSATLLIQPAFLGDVILAHALVTMGRSGVEHVIELQLNDEQKALLEPSCGHVKEVMNALDKLGQPA